MNDEELMNFVCKLDGFVGAIEILEKHKMLVLKLEDSMVKNLPDIKNEIQDVYKKLEAKKSEKGGTAYR